MKIQVVILLSMEMRRVLIGQLRNAYNRSICFRNKFSEPLTCDMRSMSEETGHSVLIQLRLNDSPISQKET